ncbi:hypothetical protein T310_6619, partial [Rasamsonia emersonii CBS 393.64]
HYPSCHFQERLVLDYLIMSDKDAGTPRVFLYRHGMQAQSQESKTALTTYRRDRVDPEWTVHGHYRTRADRERRKTSPCNGQDDCRRGQAH